MEYMLYSTPYFQLKAESEIIKELDLVFGKVRSKYLFDYCRELSGYILFFDDMAEYTLYSFSSILCSPVFGSEKFFVDESYAILKDYKI